VVSYDACKYLSEKIDHTNKHQSFGLGGAPSTRERCKFWDINIKILKCIYNKGGSYISLEKDEKNCKKSVIVSTMWN